jgi:hypothetical protein
MQGKHYDAEGVFRSLFSGPLMINTGYDKAKGHSVLASAHAYLIPHLPMALIESRSLGRKRARSPNQWEAGPIRFVQS